MKISRQRNDFCLSVSNDMKSDNNEIEENQSKKTTNVDEFREFILRQKPASTISSSFFS